MAMSTRPARQRKPSAALRFLESNEAEWEQHQRELESGASERRKARKERERAKARAERDSQKRKGPKAKKGKAKADSASGAETYGAAGPKRPTTAYFYFVAENREDVKAENPDADFGTVSRILGTEWRALSEDERAHFDALANKDKRRYERQLAAWGGTPVRAAPKAKSGGGRKRVERKPPSNYFEYCAEAIGALRARNGSSYQAIEKYITANHPDVDFKRHHFRSALARGVETGGFLKIKASFKLDPSLKKRWYRRS